MRLSVPGSIIRLLLLISLISPLVCVGESIGESLSNGTVGLNFRYRYEFVDQDGLGEDAGASTLRTRLTYTSADWQKLSVTIELDDVAYLGSDRFNSSRNGESDYPVVADPDGTQVNQAYFSARVGNGDFRLGRQRINLADQRFIGGVAWRQNEQTFDALRIRQHLSDKWSVDYSYINRVSRIFGPDDGTPPDSFDAGIHLLHFSVDIRDGHKLGLFAYDLDFDDAVGLSNVTLGVSYRHDFKSESLIFPVKVMYARQQDTADNPVSYSANYRLVELGVRNETLGARLGYERLEGANSAGKSFRTPLATLHKFQGWADKFLTTPQSGIEDLYVGLNYRSFSFTWHEFRPETGSGRLGSELNMSWLYTFKEHYSLLLKAADYDSDDFASDTRKVWLMFTAKF